MKKCTLIAEAGVNHNGSLELAKKLADEAKRAGADIVKYQTFRAEKLTSAQGKMAEYQKSNTRHEESQLEMLKKLELSYDNFVELQEYCRGIGIVFLSTPFDLESISFLNRLGLPFWKVPSGEVTNYPYLRAIGQTQKPVVLSTGMCRLSEIREAMKVLTRFGCPEISLLHCTTEYPAPKSEVNLRAMETLRQEFQVPVGYSDHTQGIEIPIAAVAMGAVMIEKHFTLDKEMEGPDHKASLNPEEWREMVSAIRNVEAALGRGIKIPCEAEEKNKVIARKSIVAARDIVKGEVFTEDNLTAKRPGNGISPMEWETIQGTKAVRDFREDELIER